MDYNEYTLAGLLAASQRGTSSKHKMMAWAYERMTVMEAYIAKLESRVDVWKPLESHHKPATAARARDSETAAGEGG